MSNLNKVPCYSSSRNTGFKGCVGREGAHVFDIIFPGRPKVPLSALLNDAAFQAWLIEQMTADNKEQRAFKLGPWVQITDNTAEPVSESFDNGVVSTLGDSAIDKTRRVTNGQRCMHKVLRSLIGQQDTFTRLEVYRSLSKDARYYVNGVTTLDADGNDVMTTIRDSDWSVPPWKGAAGQASAMIQFKTNTQDTAQLNELHASMAVNFEVGDLPDITDVTVSASLVSAGVFDVLATFTCGGGIVAKTYPDLAAAGAFTVRNQLGNIVPITSVSIVGNAFRLSLTTADSNYTAGTTFTFEFKPISVTSATPYDVEYIESNVSKPVAKA